MLSPAMVSMKGIPADTMQFGKSKVSLSLLLRVWGTIEGRGWFHRMARLGVSLGWLHRMTQNDAVGRLRRCYSYATSFCYN